VTIIAATGSTRGSNQVGGTLSSILKELYQPAITDQLNSATVLRRLIGTRELNMEGKYSVHELRVGRNFGFGVAGEGGRLPDPQAQQYTAAKYAPKYTYGRIKFTGPSASAARSDRGSFIRVMDSEVQGITQDMMHNDNRIMFGDGSGRLCQITGSGTSSGPWTVTNPGGISSTALGTQYLDNGMRVAILHPSTNDTAAVAVGTAPTATTFAGGLLAGFISSIDRSAGTVNFVNQAGTSLTLTMANTQYLYLANESSTDLTGLSWARGLEPHGLAAIVDDADPVFADNTTGNWGSGFGLIPVATYPIWKAPVLDNGGTPIPFSPDMFQQAQDLLDITSGGHVEVYVTTHGIRRQYLNTLIANKQHVNTMDLDGGFKSLSYDGRPIIVDKDCTRGRVYGLNLETIFTLAETDYAWMDQDGAVLTRLENQDAFQATLYRYWNMGTDRRNANVLIQDILDT
jgi:hypothetical protein